MSKRRRVTKFRLDEISLVDKPAQGPARIAIMKRAVDTPTMQKRAALTTSVAGHAHSLITSDSTSDLVAGQTSSEVSEGAEFGHSHSWIMAETGGIIVGEADGHTHELAQISKTVSDESVPTGSEEDNPVGNTRKDIMTKQDPKTADDAVTQEQHDELTKRSERLEKIVKLSPVQRSHFDSLEGDEQDNFLANEDKDAILKNLVDADPVVHTDLDGNEIRKSEGPTVLRLAKQNDELRKNAAKSEAIAKCAEFVKRAGEELKHLTGETDAKANLLKAVATLPEDEQEPVMAILKSKDAGMARAFETLGTSDSGEGADVNTKLDVLAKAYGEKHPDLTPEQAYTAALVTPEGRELHAQLGV